MINAFIVNRNLLTTLKNTVNFLSKRQEINIIVLDQGSTFEPTLQYYKENPYLTIVEFPHNEGPHSVWSSKARPYHNAESFILCDSDCTYDNIPDDWLDKMIYTLGKTDRCKVGFSIEINDLPETGIGIRAKYHETPYWNNPTELGYINEIDTTFALYKPRSGFAYDGIRLPRPYTMRHELWYLDHQTLNEEWKFYIDNVKYISTWGSMIKEKL
jgi:hypothetical protein